MKPAQKSGISRKYLAIMLVCFLYGGYALLIFLTDVYSAFWRNESFTASLIQRPDEAGRFPAPPDFNGTFLLQDMNQPVPLPQVRDRFFLGVGRHQFDPVRSITSPISLTLLASGIISIAASLAIWGLVRRKEVQAIREEAADNLLLPDERKVIAALKKAGFESTQNRLSSETGLGRVQVHRVIKKLEAKGLLEKHGYGMTNKIVLKKEFFE